MNNIAYLTCRAMEKNPNLSTEEATKLAIEQYERNKQEHVEHDWMEAQRKNKAVPMDARSSPFVEKRNGIEYRVSGPITTQGGARINIPAVPSDPRLRPAHQKWSKLSIITGEK